MLLLFCCVPFAELTQEDADRLLEVAKGRMKHLRQEEEDALDANPQLPSIPEDKSNVALLDSMAETLDLMDPEAQGPYADTPQPPSVLLVTRLAPSGPASSFAPQVCVLCSVLLLHPFLVVGCTITLPHLCVWFWGHTAQLLVQFSQPMIELSPEGSQVPKTPSYLHHDLVGVGFSFCFLFFPAPVLVCFCVCACVYVCVCACLRSYASIVGVWTHSQEMVNGRGRIPRL